MRRTACARLQGSREIKCRTGVEAGEDELDYVTKYLANQPYFIQRHRDVRKSRRIAS
jgi:hypothetical protein